MEGEMMDIFNEILYFMYAGGWIGLLALVVGMIGGILALLGSRRKRTGLVNWGFILAILALVVGVLGMFGDRTKVDKYVQSQLEQGMSADATEDIQHYGYLESSISMFWGFVGLMPGLWLWLGTRGKRSVKA
jgi:hypothetical protein